MAVKNLVNVAVDVDGLERTTAKFDRGAKNIRRFLAATMREEGRAVVAELKKKWLSYRPGLIPRTGKLRASLTSTVVDTGESLTMVIGSKSPYFKTHRLGMWIYPRIARALAIPYGAGLTPTGRKRYPEGPKDYPGLFELVRDAAGRAFLRNKDTENLTHRLVGAVYIPARLTWDAFILRYMQRNTFPNIREKIRELLD